MLKNKILELRNKGLTYNQIKKELNCSKSTISYHCNINSKNNMLNRNKQNKLDNKEKYKILTKLSNFNSGKVRFFINNNIKYKRKNKIMDKLYKFNIKNNKFGYVTYEDIIEKFGLETKCYLTGKNINLEKDNFNFDHIIPSCRGGYNTIDNLGITTPEANISKSYMILDEYLNLCKEVLENFGYKVIKE